MATSIDAVKDLPPGDLDLNKPQVQDVIDDLIRTKAQMEAALNAAEDVLDDVKSRLETVENTDYLVTDTDEASQAEMEAATSTSKYVSPDNITESPFVPKVVISFTGSTGAELSAKGGSVTRTTAGDWDIDFDTAFSNTNYIAVFSCVETTTSVRPVLRESQTRTTSQMHIKCTDEGTLSDHDPDIVCVAVWGDQ